MDQNPNADGMPPNIGRYQVQASVGFGAMGAVYKAFDPLIKRTLAIKTIRLDIPKNSPQYRSFLERFYHEARISGTLSHPNIVTLFDIGEELGIPFLAMEYVEGETIASILERGIKFDPERVIGLVSQIAAAIDYAHSRGVIHRDIKPSNLILAEGDRVKVTDFGIAKLVDAEMTQSGALLGTPSYMSPEQAMGDKLDGRSDIFSLGICAFEMLSGEQPFPGNNVTSILYKLVHVDPVEPANLELNGLVPQKWHEVFGKVLAKKPDDRYQTASQFVQDLEYCLGSWFGAAMGEDGTTPATVIMAAPAINAPPPPRVPEPEPTAALPAIAPAALAERARSGASPVPAVADSSEEPTVVMRAPSALPRVAPASKASPAAAPSAEPQTVLMKAPAPEDVTARYPVPPVATRSSAAAAPRPMPPPAARTPTPPTSAVTTPVARPGVLAATPVPGAAPAPPGGSRSAMLIVVAAAGALLLLVGGGLTVWKLRGDATPEVVATPVPTTTRAATRVPTAAPVQTAAPTLLHVETTPPGATLYVDGEAKGVTPLDISDIAPGVHEVRVELAGYETQTQAVEINAEAPQPHLVVALAQVPPSPAVADISSLPAGAAVTIDGKSAGVTPLADITMRPGSRKIEIRKDGFDPYTTTLRVGAGKKARLHAELIAEVKATASPTPKVDTVDLNHVYEESDGGVTPPKKTKGPSSPSYPSGAPKLKSGDSVSVSISWVVSETGEITDARITESAGKVLDDAVLQMLRGQRYDPGSKQGKPIKVRLVRKYTFRAG
jgi:TonB family protein